MLESEARKVLLTRAVEEGDPDLLLPETLEAARAAAGSVEESESWLVRRAEHIVARLDPGIQSALETHIPPAFLWALIPGVALALGMATSPLGPVERIHAFINPLVALIVWNLGLYVAMALMPLLRPKPALAAELVGTVDTTVRSFGWLGRVVWSGLRGVGRLLRRLVGAPETGATPSGAATARTHALFQSLYARQCGELIASRARGISSLAAIGFALGTLAGMYLRGIGYDYHVTWQSTLVDAPETREALLRAIFFPASLLLGDAFPGSAQVARLGSTEGAPAAIWLHVYAICAAVYIVIPRLGILAYKLMRVGRGSQEVTLDLDEPYWEKVFEPPASANLRDFERSVMRDFALDANATTVLASSQAGLVEADIRETPAGGLRDQLGAKKEWYGRWRELWERRFEAFPSDARPRIVSLDSGEFDAAVAGLAHGANPYATDLILLEVASFAAYWPLGSERPGRMRRLLPGLSLGASVQQGFLEDVTARLRAKPGAAVELHRDLHATLKSLSRYWLRLGVGAVGGVALGALTFGIAAPVIGGLIGTAMAVSSAALHAGLAALGFGALATGGLGLAGGGTGLVVGGGALLGLVGGSSAATSASSLTAESALLLAAKIEVFMRRVLVARHRDWTEYHSVLRDLETATTAFRDALPELRIAPDVSSRHVRDRERVLEILEKLLVRGAEWAQAQGKGRKPA